MKITAAKKLSISAEQDILFAGKKRIVLIGGGSYLKLEAGRIEYGTEAKYQRKTKRTHKAVAREMEVDMPWLAGPAENKADALMQYLYHDNAPVVGAPFTATLPDGTVKSGNLDGLGFLHLKEVPEGTILQVEIGADARSFKRKNQEDNQLYHGTQVNADEIDALIAKHNGGD